MTIATALLFLASVLPTTSAHEASSAGQPACAPTTWPTESSGISVQAGILVFGDANSFEHISHWLEGLDSPQADAWEDRIGFVSQRRLFDQVVEAEYEIYLGPYENASDEQLQHLTPPQGHSAIYGRCLTAGVIQAIGDTYDYAVSRRSLVRVIDEHGFFVVGDTLFQAQRSYFKEWRNATLGDRAELNAATKSDPRRGMSVFDAREDEVADSPAPAGTIGSFTKSTGWVTSGHKRGRLDVTFNRKFVYPYPYLHLISHYDVNVQSQTKNFWGHWNFSNCPNECWISGSWTAKFDLLSLATLSYAGAQWGGGSYSYPYHPNCMNNFLASFSPLKGTNVGAGNGVIDTAPTGTNYIEATIAPMTWTASVPGGIQLTVTN